MHSSYVALIAKRGRFLIEVLFDDDLQSCVVTYQHFLRPAKSISISYKTLDYKYGRFVVINEALRTDVSHALRLYSKDEFIGEIRHNVPSTGWSKKQVESICNKLSAILNRHI